MWGSKVSQVSYSFVTSSIVIVYVTLEDGVYPLCVCSSIEFSLVEDYAMGKCFIDVVLFINKLGIECVTSFV